MRVSLTQNLVQLHNGRIGTDTVHRLGLLAGLAILKNLLVLVARLVGRHGESIGVGACDHGERVASRKRSDRAWDVVVGYRGGAGGL